jgi:hypothetical protein
VHDGTKVDNPKEVKEVIVNDFQNLLSEPDPESTVICSEKRCPSLSPKLRVRIYVVK